MSYFTKLIQLDRMQIIAVGSPLMLCNHFQHTERLKFVLIDYPEEEKNDEEL